MGDKSIYEFEVERLNGDRADLREYEGKVMLIVNTASECGFTPQFAGLEKLYEKFAGRGLAVLGFPCNQFGHQDPGSNEQIGAFCQKNYGVSFPMYAKIDVNGGGAHPLYRHLTHQKRGLLGTRRIKWNFTKFLVDKHGNVIARYAPNTKPERLEQKIQTLLSAD
jgi:glutathione peroxidase